MTVISHKLKIAGTSIAAAALAIALTACGTTELNNAAVVSKKLAPPAPLARWVLTGELATTDINVPGVAVKIENSPEARPQAGMDKADMVIEELVEGGITRFMVVFNSKIPEAAVGPVRSVRPMDPPLAASLNTSLVYSGGQPQFVAMVKAAGIQSYTEGAEGMFRRKDRKAPHNLYFDLQAAIKNSNDQLKKGPHPQFAFATQAGKSSIAKEGSAATHLTAKMSGSFISNWDWDAAAGKWKRSQGSKEFMAEGGGQIAVANVIALNVQVQDSGARDPAGASVPETLLSGQSGTGKIAADGKILDIKWSKKSDSDPIALTDAAGKQIRLEPGQVWINLVPQTGSIDF